MLTQYYSRASSLRISTVRTNGIAYLLPDGESIAAVNVVVVLNELSRRDLVFCYQRVASCLERSVIMGTSRSVACSDDRMIHEPVRFPITVVNRKAPTV